MSLREISPENKKQEVEIQEKIYKNIDECKSMIFNAGAGAGKTYALIESLKYAVKNYSQELKTNNQEIICITYTNVATNEVKNRLGNASRVLVSTIHERVWDLIKKHQKELVELHKEALLEQISELDDKIDTGKEYARFRELDEDKKALFVKLMNENKELFNRCYDYKAEAFKKAFTEPLCEFTDILKSVANFKEIVSTIFKISNYQQCCTNIADAKPKYKSIEYKPIYNTDQLHKMRISHDTLLVYGFKIIEKYDLLKQVIVDKYPYIFIDEYQDTHVAVAKIMNTLQQFANANGKKIFIGYFGDTAQNIYEKGVGKDISGICPDLKQVEKEFNRRSKKEVIDVANKIRNDSITQKSIYSDCAGGVVKFYTGGIGDVDSFIIKYIKQWNITCENQLHCFVLTNETVAKYSGFENIYNIFKLTKKYSGYNYKQLNTELLSNDESKLGEIPNLIFRIIKLFTGMGNNHTLVKTILFQQIYINMSMFDLKSVVNLLYQITGNTLGEYIQSITKIYATDEKGQFKEIIDTIFDFKDLTFEKFSEFIMERLFPSLNDDEIEDATVKIKSLFDINMSEYVLWYKYILNEWNGKIIYHTYHGTKGLEFENVLILMGNSFGLNKNYFNFYFENYVNSVNLTGANKEKFEEIRNLLYVSATRSITNLRILYTDDTNGFVEGIKQVFSQLYPFQMMKED